MMPPPAAFSSEVGTGSRQENASNQESGVFSVSIVSKRKKLQGRKETPMTVNGTSAVAGLSAPSARGRIDWVDYAKGICIVMVVMMHSVLGVELAAEIGRASCRERVCMLV